MPRKSFLNNRRKADKPTKTDTPLTTAKPPVKGDLDGDGDVDLVDKLIAAVQFIQSPKGQMLVLVAAAVFSLIINLSTYTESMGSAFAYLDVEWLAPLDWLAAIVSYLLIQVLETMPRTGWWDLDLKITILRKLRGLDVPMFTPSEGMQTDVLYWQETARKDWELKRKIMIVVSIAAHLVDLWALWIDFPLWQDGRLSLHPNLWIVLALMFSFEGLVALSMFIRQFTAKPKHA